jgi:hypothetical protein
MAPQTKAVQLLVYLELSIHSVGHLSSLVSQKQSETKTLDIVNDPPFEMSFDDTISST